MKPLSLIILILGLVLLVCSFTWAMLFPAASSWTKDKDQRMSELRLKGHALGGELDAAQRKPSMHGRSAADIEVEYNQVKAEMAELREDFENGRDAPHKMAVILRWVGVVCIAIGAFVSYTGKA